MIGAKLKSRRKKLKMTLQRLSEETGFSVASLSLYENNKTDLTFGKAEVLCNHLHLKLKDLFK